MDEFDRQWAQLLTLCVERLGDELGRVWASFATPAVHIELVAHDPTIRSRFGGPALLDPGTPSPQLGGFPLTLLAVLDFSELPKLPGVSVPTRGLVNLFHCDPAPGVEYPQNWEHNDSAVLASDADIAIEVTAPALATTYPPGSMLFRPMLTLPYWDHFYHDGQEGPWRDRLSRDTQDQIDDVSRDWERQYGRVDHQAFGYGIDYQGFLPAYPPRWKRLPDVAGFPEPYETRTKHLLLRSTGGSTGDGDGSTWEFGDGGGASFTITDADLSAGDFSHVEMTIDD